MKSKIKFLVLLFAMAVSGAYGQQVGKVTGTVEDNLGPVAGAAVQIKGTTTGTVTDVDGKFSLNVAPGQTLVVSFIGYVTQEIVVGNQQRLTVKLLEDSRNLDEVFVVAYGTAKKSTYVGSATPIKAEQIEKISGSQFLETLQGASAGVNIVNNEGNPGGSTRIQIRGVANTRGYTEPLYVVDGAPYEGSINNIAPSDIESMTVLKDAAAASLYGSRAANGVVLITTKKGKSGKPALNFRLAWGTSDNATPNPVKANPYQQLLNSWTAVYNDQHYRNGLSEQEAGDYASQTFLSKLVNARTNSKGETVYVTPFRNLAPDQYVFHDGKGNPYVNPNLEMVWDESDYDWYGAVFKRKLRQDYSFDISGATPDSKTNYFVSAAHLNDGGYANNQYYKRYSFRTNINTEINRRLSMGGSLAYTYSRQNTSGSNRALVFSNTLNSPWLRNADNTDWFRSEKTGMRIMDVGENTANYFGIHVLNNSGDYWNNPDDEEFNNNEGGLMKALYYAELKLPLDIKFKTSVNIDDIRDTHYGYGSVVHLDGQMPPYGVTPKTGGGSASRDNYKTFAVTWSNLLSWEKTTGDNHFNVLAGHEFYNKNMYYNSTYGEGIMMLGQYEVESTTRNWSGSSYRDRYALLSFLGKLEYDYQNKYYVSGSIRSDGSSRFHPDHRWGTFFSFGANWRISKESFLAGTEWLDNLAIRGSYGTSGNDNIDDWYAYQGTYAADDLYSNPGYKPSALPTPNLIWEKNVQYNFGIDFSVFNRLNGTIEYYTRSAKDLLYYKELPLSAWAGDAEGYNTNIGDIRNNGVEISLSATAINTPDFNWIIDANFTTIHNEITNLPTKPYLYQRRGVTYKMEEGLALYSFFLPRSAGVNPDNGNEMFYIKDANGSWTTTENWSDVVAERDYVYAGSALPKGFASLTNAFNYKQFDFSFMWYLSYGSKLYDMIFREATANRQGVGAIQELIEGKVWKKPGDIAEFPRWSWDAYTSTVYQTDRFLFDNTYLRLRNISLGYSLSKNVLKKAGIANLRIYITADNLLTFSRTPKYTAPETGILGNNYNGNEDTDNGIQSSRRVYMGGIQLTF